MNVAQAARAWLDAGVSLLPILPNGSKRSAVAWAQYQEALASPNMVDQWFGNGTPYGLGLICGRISGDLEMLELEGRACDSASLSKIMTQLAKADLHAVWSHLNGSEGYSEWSPNGGLHLLYRISDHPVPGNTKIAQDEQLQCLAETRGEGGYVVVAPTSGACHPTGEAWTLINGTFGVLPEITWEQRCALHEALRLALDSRPLPQVQTPAPSSSVVLPRAPAEGAGLSPLDDFEERTDWADILIPAGWSLFKSFSSGERWWTRPGKGTRDGHSATTGHASDRERLYVFSSSTVFNIQTSYTKPGAYGMLFHGGDMKATAAELARRGFGDRAQLERSELELRRPTEGDKETGEEPRYIQNDDGNAQYLRDRVDGDFLFVEEESRYFAWDGQVWRPDVKGTLQQVFKQFTRERHVRAIDEGNKIDASWWKQSGNAGRTEAALKMMRTEPGVSVSTTEMNLAARSLNVKNGILDLDTGVLKPHDPKQRMTRLFGAYFDPQAECPSFVKFMEDVLPDPVMRAYVQRALGYTLLGDVDQRAMFMIHGPSGTGKSTLMEAMREVFGDYGITAPPGAFRAKRADQGPTNDLHALRGRRFVTTSETAEGANFDEDLLKRLTGRDRVQSRELYQTNQEWTPECVIWLATNHPPRFNSDDDAIWRRTKLIPFVTQFLGDGEIPDMARTVLAPEASGILNWLLVGLKDYLANGLGEPTEVREAAEEQRLQSDSVARFLEDRVADGVFSVGSGQLKGTEAYMMYVEWTRQVGDRPLGRARFDHRMLAHPFGLTAVKDGSKTTWHGISKALSASMLGSFFGPQFGQVEQDA